MVATIIACAGLAVGAAGPSPAETELSVFLPPRLVQAARSNVARYKWAREARDRIVEGAAPWLAMTDDHLWGLMFGNTIKRSWMVWSNGRCPSCRKSVPMYTWEMDALKRPWKVRCPHCKDLFPKNDFERFYRSGLNEQGVFDPDRADRSLLVNAEHPDAGDPLRAFGVDDGEGYVEGADRWRFIGAYLIYGQWKQAVVAGIRNLADAYVVTGDAAYAHKAGILLDRVADLYPTFDFGKEGVMYEGPPSAGYVSTWHDACEETRGLALAYDQVRSALQSDEALAAFLAQKARAHRLDNPKSSWADIKRNIEDRLLRDPIENRHKIHSNYPRTEIALATLTMALGWPSNRAEVTAILDPMLQKATAVDGVTGEKGLAGYSAFTIQGVAAFLAQLARLDASMLKDLLARHPRLHSMFRFHVDTWCLGAYYPQTGDTGGFATPYRRYAGASFGLLPGIEASMFTLMMHMYRATGDPTYVQIAFLANGGSVRGLPHDLFCDNPEAYEKEAALVTRRHGPTPAVASVNKEEWRLAILRSGKKEHARAVWLDYDAGGAHGHADALNLGLFSHGLDLLPEFGYPPVQFGGWGSPRARWYTMSAAHNTAVIDGGNQKPASGVCTLFGEGETLHAVRAECPETAQAQRFERTVALCDVNEQSAYILDILRVAGGSEHVKFQHSHFGTLALGNLADLKAEPDFGHETQMRAFRMGRIPENGLIADWTVDDRQGILPARRTVGLRHWEMTEGADAGRCEAWIATGGYNASEELWIPRLVVRRRGPELRSAFISLIEPHAGSPAVSAMRRLRFDRSSDSASTGAVALEITRTDGFRDIVIARDAASAKETLHLDDPHLAFDGDLARVTLDRSGRPVSIAAIGCASLQIGDLLLRGKDPRSRKVIELCISGRSVRAIAGGDAITHLSLKGRAVR